MGKVFFALYPEDTQNFYEKIVHRGSVTYYRINKAGFMDELKEKGFDATVVFTPEDVESIKADGYSHDLITSEELEFLKHYISKWEVK